MLLQRQYAHESPGDRSAFMLVKTLTKVEICFSLTYPSGHKWSMATGTQDSPILLLCHPQGTVFMQGVSPPLYLHFINRKGERQGGESRRYTRWFCPRLVAAGKAGKWSQRHLPQGAKRPNYLHRKPDYYIQVSKKDYSFVKSAFRKSQ